MKHIKKQDEPKELSDWKALANEDWQPSYDNLSGETKNAIKNALIAEQGAICSYCERRLTNNDSHIEHFMPQSHPAADPLDYGNLLCSCQNQIMNGEPRHCGNLKGDWFNQDLLVSPLDPDCEKRFAFTGDGEIKSLKDYDLAAAETIKKLGLDIPKLNALRANAIEPFLDDGLSHQDMQAFVSGYLNRDTSGQFGEFWTTIGYLFGGLVVA
ncbi:MAG: TIGR02646 family protein [Acidobacteria bacterium]|nr:TIGR02646 family protein [Acidobacteriota bacterium]